MKWSDLKWFSNYYLDTMANVDSPDTLPKKENFFRAMEVTPFDKVKVVIIGQDPYHTKGYADGLAFSVQPHVKPFPPSLRNVLKEYSDDLGVPVPRTGSLLPWAERGVLLWNSLLSVREGHPGSHRGLGWEKLTHEVVSSLSKQRSSIVWLLWGKFAQEYEAAIGTSNGHHVIRSGHPSPLSAHLFLGTKPFSRACEFLGETKQFWKLP